MNVIRSDFRKFVRRLALVRILMEPIIVSVMMDIGMDNIANCNLKMLS